MMFDPYRKWLGILPKDQPPHHYRLLSLELFEHDLDVIEGAADRAMGFIRQYQSGEQAQFAAKLLNEIATARLCLLKPDSKQKYDAKLRQEIAARQETIPPVSQPIAKLVVNHEEDDAFSYDVAPPAILRSAKPAASTDARKSTKRSKSSKKKSSNTVFIAGGVGAAVCVALVVMNLGQKPPQKADSVPNQVAELNSARLTAPVPSPVRKTAGKSDASNEANVAAASKSVSVVEPLGVPVNLVEAVELPRDQLRDAWKKEGTSLVGRVGGTIYFPVQVPDAYQLKFIMKRISGREGCGIGFSSEGHAGVVFIDRWDSKFSGLCVDGREPTANCTTVPGSHFETGKSATVVLTVVPEHVLVTFNGKSIIDWYGKSDRHYVPTFLNVPHRESPFIEIVGCSLEIESAELIPIRSKASMRVARLEKWLDIIPLLNAKQDAQIGTWSRDDNALQSPASPFAKYSLPVAVPEEYTWSANVELPSESAEGSTLVLGLVAGKTWCSIALVNGNCLGLEKIDGIRWDGDPTWVTGEFFTPKKPFNVACTVTKNTIRMDIDGRTVLNWTGDFGRLSPQVDWAPFDATRLMIGTIANFKIRDIKLGPPTDPPGLPSHPKIEPGRPLDLISLIDPKRDALLGTWSKEGTNLVVSNDVELSKLVIPCEIPAEYKLTIRAIRDVGGKADAIVVLKLPTEHSLAQVILDGWGSNLNGLILDYLLADDRKNTSARRIPAIPPGVPQDLVVYVRKTGIKVMNGDKVLTEFAGNTDRLSPTKWPGSAGGRIAIANSGSRLRLEKLEVEPLEVSSFPAVKELGSDGNLLAVIEPLRDSRRGGWKLDANVLVSPTMPFAWIRIPVPVPQRYVLSANVERKSGNGDLLLGLVVGGHPCNVTIDGMGSTQAGLTKLDGVSYADPSNVTRRVYKSPIFPIGESVKVQLVVLSDTVIVVCGNKEVVSWHGDSRRLSLHAEIQPPNYSGADRDHLWLAAWESEFWFRDLKLRPIEDDEAERISSRFTGVTPTKFQANVPFPVAKGIPAR